MATARIAAIFGPLLAPQDPNHVDLGAVFAGPSGDHLLGTDASGRDLLSRLLVGARSALLGPLIVSVLATGVGLLIALAMAWRGGVVDTVGARGLDVLFAFPGLLAAILAVAMFGKGLTAPAIALALVYLPYVARVIRSAALAERGQAYVAVLTLQGLSAWRIASRHIVPNIAPIIIAQAVVAFSYALIDLAAISFLGLGIQPPSSDWGLMVAEGQSAIVGGHPQESLLAGLCIVAVIVSVNVLGERAAGGPEELR
jgi:peptide/nickel transport system permease protein